MKYQKHIGIIINRHSLKDADRFLTILTREMGKISVYARSVRSIKSRRAASLELFSEISFGLVEKGGRFTLTHVELLDSYSEGKKALKDISRLFILGELIDSLLVEHDPQPEVYELLGTALTHLPRFDTPDYLTRFKRKLLTILGFWDPDRQEKDLDSYIESLLSRPLRTGHIL